MGWLLLVLAGTLYYLTHDNGLFAGELETQDLPTLQYAQIYARPANGPGYPVYTMIGFLWFHSVRFFQGAFFDPLPNPIPIFSTYNTIWALLALWLLYRLLLRLTPATGLSGPRWLFPWLICMFYACTYLFWFHANSSEQYCSVVAQTLALVLLFLKWEESLSKDRQRPGKNKPGPGSLRLLYAMAFLCGLFLAHQVTATMIVPPLIISVLHRQPSLLRLPKVVLGAVLAAAVPLTSYIFIYFRGAADREWRGEDAFESNLDWLWGFVSTPQGLGEISLGLQAGQPFFTEHFPLQGWQEVGLPVLFLGLLGLALLRPRLRFLLFGTVLFYLAFTWINRFGNWRHIFMPAYPLILLGLLPMAVRVQRTIARWMMGQSVSLQEPARPIAAMASAVPILFLLGTTYWTVTSSWDKVDQRDRAHDTALDMPAMLLAQELPPQTFLYAEYPVRVGLGYLTSAWGFRPDLSAVSEGRAKEHLKNGGRVAVTKEAARYLLKLLQLNDSTLR